MKDPLAALFETIVFPDPRSADSHGLVAIGGDFRPAILLAAYRAGIFPWPSRELPYAWFSPDPRLILRPGELRLGRSARKALRRCRYRVTFDTAFDRVIEACASISRPGDAGTWIVPELRRGFQALHRQGYAHSVETWHGEDLVGGLYGLSLGEMFCGESMFHRRPDASKAAMLALAQRLEGWRFRFIDCQVHTDHMEHLGAREIPRSHFLDELQQALTAPTRRGRWTGSSN